MLFGITYFKNLIQSNIFKKYKSEDVCIVNRKFLENPDLNYFWLATLHNSHKFILKLSVAVSSTFKLFLTKD
jgi:hypothetical protein